MKILNLAAVCILFVFTACCTSSKTTNGAAMNENTMEAKQMMENGFTMGTIVASTAEDDCPYVIKSQIDDTEVLFDPINLEEGFMKDNMKVWYKYNPLRMANRCQKANPVSLTEIKEMK